MVLDRRKLTLFGAAAVLRLVLFVAFPSLPKLLAGRVEISTPVTSFKRREQYPTLSFRLTSKANNTHRSVQEGLFLYTHNVSPYDGGIFHQVKKTRLKLFHSSDIKGASPSTIIRPHTRRCLFTLDEPPLHPP